MVARLRLLLFLGILALFSSACQSAETAPVEPTPMQWQRVTFVASLLDPGFALNIPADWRYEVGDTGIIVFNYPRLLQLESEGVDMPSGSRIASLTILSAADVQRLGARNAASILDVFVGESSDDGLGPQYLPVNTIDINGRDSAQFYVSIGGRDSLLMAVDLAGNYVMAIVIAPEGELQQSSDMLNQIFGSLELRVTE